MIVLEPAVPLVAGVEALAQTETPGVSKEWTVDEVIKGLARQEPQEVAFEESTMSSMLTAPLKTKGVLVFTPPSRLEKHVTDPLAERYIIDGNTVLYRNDKRRLEKSFSLDEYPALRMFVEIFRSALAGDPLTLKRYYQATVEGEPRRWSLLLRPLDRAGESMVQEVRLIGAGGRLTRIEMRFPDGDHSVMRLQGPPSE